MVKSRSSARGSIATFTGAVGTIEFDFVAPVRVKDDGIGWWEDGVAKHILCAVGIEFFEFGCFPK